MNRPGKSGAAARGDSTSIGGMVMQRLGLGRSFGCGGVLVLAGIVLVLFFMATTRVDAGEACAVTRFGAILGRAEPGLHLRLPGVDRFYCYRTARTFYEVVDEQNALSGADFVDPAVDGVTRDGQPVNVTFNIAYRLPNDKVDLIYANIGKTIEEVNDRVIKFHARSVTRQQIQKLTATQLYSGDLDQASQQIAALLSVRFSESYVELLNFEMKRPRFDPDYEEAIEQQQIALEQIETRRNEAAAAAEEAKKAEAVARGQANAERIRAEGEADAIRLRGEAVRANPEIISLNYIEALKTIDWAILDSSSVTQYLPVQPPTGGSPPASAPPPVTPAPTPTAEAG